MPSPKPLPTRIKLLRGTLKSSRANPDEPLPEPLTKLPRPPAWMDRRARRYWRLLGRRLVGERVLTHLDLPAFEQLCDWLGRADEIREIIDAMPHATKYVARSERGGAYINPLFNTMIMARREALKLAVEFGITPSSRQKVRALKDDSNAALAEVLGLS